MPDMKIFFNKPFIVGRELYYIAQSIIENRHTAGNGPFTRKCQDWLTRTLGCRGALLTHSGTAALEMAAILAGVGPGDEVVMPSFTFVSTANAFVLRGATPVFVDIHPDTLSLDESLVEAALTPRTRAVVPVHYAGACCDMARLMALAREHGLTVIEDAAQALLSTLDGKPLGSIGHLGCLSFHETKNIICGEGGALLVNDPRYLERAEIVWEKGTNRQSFFRGEVDKYTWCDIGSSYLPSDILAAFLFAQFEHADEIVARRQELCARYRQGLEPLARAGLLELPAFASQGPFNGHIFCILARSLDERTRLIRFLDERGVKAIFHYVPLHSSPAGHRFGRVSGSMAVTDRVSDCLLRLPLYHEMPPADVDRVVGLVREFHGLGEEGSRAG